MAVISPYFIVFAFIYPLSHCSKSQIVLRVLETLSLLFCTSGFSVAVVILCKCLISPYFHRLYIYLFIKSL